MNSSMSHQYIYMLDFVMAPHQCTAVTRIITEQKDTPAVSQKEPKSRSQPARPGGTHCCSSMAPSLVLRLPSPAALAF